ncbi:uncharacterized protein LOC123682830 isoform X1 [Harmonia axyridis]|uniref:uncharacterized protein LOC123682830 isoform X1 n=1 Tax=Harmonia axyridis TaxID=115357 RepID=UPI001E27536C|nr:uncharacterized protein LOC123682830 isoform X1 [Harmonia axyridis]
MNLKVQIFLICSVSCALSFDLKQRKRQISQGTNTEIEPEPSATGFQEAAAVQAGSKYFQDIYMAQHKPGEIEFGHVSETPNDWEQRFEKINFEDNNRQGKVRWGDKHGGYGEHYWDYNHAGHDGHDGEESSHNEQYAAYEEEGESVPVPTYADNSRGKREQLNQDVEFISPKARSLVLSGVSGKHGGNYMSEKDFERRKREQKKRKIKSLNGDYLLYQPETGRVVDHKTGITYELKPVEF